MDWATLKADIEADWRKLVAFIEGEEPKVEPVLAEIVTALGALGLGGAGHVVEDISTVAQGLYSSFNTVVSTVDEVDPLVSGTITATQLVQAAVAVTNAIPNIAASLRVVKTDAETTLKDLKVEEAH
jgi:hypothetical protein